MSCLITVLFLGGPLPPFGTITFHRYENNHSYNLIGLDYANNIIFYDHQRTLIDCNNYILFYLLIFCSFLYAFFCNVISMKFTIAIFEKKIFILEFIDADFSIFKFLFFSHFFWFVLKLCFMLWLFIAVRAIVPRYRYDQLMQLGWKNFLPLSLFFVIFYSSLFIINFEFLSHSDPFSNVYIYYINRLSKDNKATLEEAFIHIFDEN